MTLYHRSIPIFERGLQVLAELLRKAEVQGTSSGLDPSDLIQSKLAPDMMDLRNQVQRAADAAKNSLRRLTNLDVPVFDDIETTFDQLHARIERTLQILAQATEGDFDNSQHRIIVLNFPSRRIELNGETYLTQFVIPNFYFHITTAYDIMRNKGIKLGKLDYLGFAE